MKRSTRCQSIKLVSKRLQTVACSVVVRSHIDAYRPHQRPDPISWTRGTVSTSVRPYVFFRLLNERSLHFLSARLRMCIFVCPLSFPAHVAKRPCQVDGQTKYAKPVLGGYVVPELCSLLLKYVSFDQEWDTNRNTEILFHRSRKHMYWFGHPQQVLVCDERRGHMCA